jgi:hypothetical protein
MIGDLADGERPSRVAANRSAMRDSIAAGPLLMTDCEFQPTVLPAM